MMQWRGGTPHHQFSLLETFPYGPQARSLSLPLPLQTKLLFLCGLVTIGRPRPKYHREALAFWEAIHSMLYRQETTDHLSCRIRPKTYPKGTLIPYAFGAEG